MYHRLVVDGNAVYEIDDECMKRRQGRRGYGGKNRGPGNAMGHTGADVSEAQQ